MTFTNPFYSALSLIGNLASLAVLYLLLAAEFVAAAQVLVYAGAVMVMFLFVIAYVGQRSDTVWTGGPSWQLVGGVLAGGAILVEVIIAIGLGASGRLSDAAEIGEAFGSPSEIGRLFLTEPPARLRDHLDRAARGRGRRGGARRPEPPVRRGGLGAMMGPEIPLYLTVASFLFATGALGVLLRRNPLIVLLSLEIMLNGANLAFISFARRLGDGDGQIFAVAVMAVAASEVVVGLGLVVALHRRDLELDVDQLSTLRG